MSDNLIQTSFSAGELSPSILARTDLAKYKSGTSKMRNFFVDYRSGASSRPGLEFINFAKSSPIKLVPFQFSSDISYVIEFGDFYCRFYTQGSAVLEAAKNITAINNANPCVITVPGHGYSVGDWIFVRGAGGMIQINNRYYRITNVAGNDLTISMPLGNQINSTGYGVYTSGGTVARVYTIASPYAAADLATLKYAQRGNSLTITHPSYAPQRLTATAGTSWAFSVISFATTVSAPTGLAGVATAAGTANFSYIVTAVDASGQESLPSAALAVNNVVNIQTTAGTITITWTPVAGAISYNIYRSQVAITNPVPTGQAYGFQGQATQATFIDSNVVPDFSQTPPIANNPFAAGNNPACVCFFQQRAYYGGSNNFPATFYASQPGLYDNFNKSDPIIDSDTIEGTLVSIQLNAIKYMLPMPGGLILLTSAGSWQLSSGGGLASTGAVTPSNATANPQAYNGIGDVLPLVVNYDILYVQSKGCIVRDLSYNIYANIYTGADISVLSNHLFFNETIVDWAFAEEPYKIIWSARGDGLFLSLTYVKEQEMFGWAQHDTFGLMKNTCVIREGIEDSLYVGVLRDLGGSSVTVVERMAQRVFPYGAEDAFCVDCGLSSTLPKPAATLVASSSSGAVTFAASAAVFTSGDVGKVLRMDNGIANITGFSSSTIISGVWTQEPNEVVPNDPNETPVPAASGSWSIAMPFSTFVGLDHLEGLQVAILADGGVVPPQTVQNGSIILPSPATKVHVGLPYTCQLQTMPLDAGTPTIQAKRKNINALSLRCANTRGSKVGRGFDFMTAIKQLSPTVILGQPIPLLTGDYRIVMDSVWDVYGQVCIQQDDPLPVTILGLISEVSIGDT